MDQTSSRAVYPVNLLESWDHDLDIFDIEKSIFYMYYLVRTIVFTSVTDDIPIIVYSY